MREFVRRGLAAEREQLRHLARIHLGEMGVHHLLGVTGQRPGERLDQRHLHLQPPTPFARGDGAARPRSSLNGRPPSGSACAPGLRAPLGPCSSRRKRAFISRLETEPGSGRAHITPNRAAPVWVFVPAVSER